MAPPSKQQQTATTATTIFNEFHATRYSYHVHTISKNAILGGTITFAINGYKKKHTNTHTHKYKRTKKKKGREEKNERKERKLLIT